jgi:hypothetical protein
MLNTHSLQAPGFYARFGYREGGRTPGYPHGHDDIHLVKAAHLTGRCNASPAGVTEGG